MYNVSFVSCLAKRVAYILCEITTHGTNLFQIVSRTHLNSQSEASKKHFSILNVKSEFEMLFKYFKPLITIPTYI